MELNPCPFCGCNEIQIDEMESNWDAGEMGWRALCTYCGVDLQCKTEQEVISNWNARIPTVDVKNEEDGWTPVSEGLPTIVDGSLNYSELFLVTANINDRTYTYLAYFGSCLGFSGLLGGDWNEIVTAWQPVPKPYRAADTAVKVNGIIYAERMK